MEGAILSRYVAETGEKGVIQSMHLGCWIPNGQGFVTAYQHGKRFCFAKVVSTWGAGAGLGDAN